MSTTRSQGELSPGSQPPPNTNDTPPQVHDQTGGGNLDQRELGITIQPQPSLWNARYN